MPPRQSSCALPLLLLSVITAASKEAAARSMFNSRCSHRGRWSSRPPCVLHSLSLQAARLVLFSTDSSSVTLTWLLCALFAHHSRLKYPPMKFAFMSLLSLFSNMMCSYARRPHLLPLSRCYLFTRPAHRTLDSVLCLTSHPLRAFVPWFCRFDACRNLLLRHVALDNFCPLFLHFYRSP